jgi:hypothetical protein
MNDTFRSFDGGSALRVRALAPAELICGTPLVCIASNAGPFGMTFLVNPAEARRIADALRAAVDAAECAIAIADTAAAEAAHADSEAAICREIEADARGMAVAVAP